MIKLTEFKEFVFEIFYSYRFQSIGMFNYLENKFDYFNWWIFKFVYFVSFLVITYVLLRFMTYSFHSEFFYGFFEMLTLGLKLFFRNLREILVGVNSVVEDNVRLVVTMRDVDREALKSIPDYQDLPKSSDTEYARIFDPSPDDFEDNYWIDPSVFDIWSYNLVSVPGTLKKNEEQIKSSRDLSKVLKSKKIRKK